MLSAETLYRRSPGWMQAMLLNAHAWRIGRHRYGHRYRTATAQLLEQERWPAERIRRYQDERLRELVRIAYERSPYYSEIMRAAGLEPSDVQGVSDLVKLPILTKQVVRSRAHDLLTRRKPARGWVEGHTSGTTGSPLGIWYDRQTCVMNNAVDRRQKIWGGLCDAEWIGLLLGRIIVPPRQTRPPFWRLDWIQRQVWFSSFHLGDQYLDTYVQEMKRRRLRFLEGYPSTLYILAKYLLVCGRRLPMHAVFSSSETLHALQREAIETAFECRLFDFYGLAERVIFASECELHAGKHLAEEFGYTEVVDEDGFPVPDGQPGYLVGTSLHNQAMPLIRYRTSDVSTVWSEPCPCGRTLRRLRNVTTKAEDIVVTPDGRMISPSILTHPFKPLDRIVKSQIVQARLDHLLVKIVPASDFSLEHQRALVEGLTQRLGAGVTIEVRCVDDIPREPSGKYRWVVSSIRHPCALSWSDASQ